MLLEFCELYRTTTDWRIVEPAHMEIAEPSIQQAIGAQSAAPPEAEQPEVPQPEDSTAAPAPAAGVGGVAAMQTSDLEVLLPSIHLIACSC
jgi:hypothetical protein